MGLSVWSGASSTGLGGRGGTAGSADGGRGLLVVSCEITHVSTLYYMYNTS